MRVAPGWVSIDCARSSADTTNMRLFNFRMPRTPIGVAATLALALSVLGSSTHNHALDDGLEVETRVCVVAGIAVLPAGDVAAGCASAAPPFLFKEAPVEVVALRVEARRADRARAPPVLEFVSV